MSQENVEVAQAAFRAWNVRDMGALRELYDPDVIMRFAEGWPEPGPFVGRDAVMRQLEQMRETWDADALEPTGDFTYAADRVAVRQVWRGAGHGPISVTLASDPGERQVRWVEGQPGEFAVHLTSAPPKRRPQTAFTYVVLESAEFGCC